MYKIQDVFLKPIIGNDSIESMYYRGNDRLDFITLNDGSSKVPQDSFFETFTYFGSLSVEKWSKYTYACKFYLVLRIKGNFELTLFGHYVENNKIQKEYFGKYEYEVQEETEIIVAYPVAINSQVVAFSIQSKSELIIYDSYYAADLEKSIFTSPYISLVTTTFKKENFIRKNILLLKDELLSSEDFGDKFCWHIIDNGQTLEEKVYKNIFIKHNKNVGGAGGFARGILDSLRQKNPPSHILLMDDDVNVSPESFKRLYRLLNILRPEYSKYFISGAMLNMDAPNIQHENTGTLEDGYCKPLSSGRDLNCWDQVVLNEQIDDKTEFRYAAWWFCCIPTSVVSINNLPLPLFVRGDDMEYSIRNHAKFITMNGLSIWHMGFGGKYNSAMECYQAKRNELIVFSLRDELKTLSSFKKIEELFWQNIYKFDYISAGFLIEAVEDYLKGPEWLSEADLYNELSERRSRDNKKKDISSEIEKYIDYDRLYSNDPVSKIKKFIYDYTFNGQSRFIPIRFKKRIGIIPYNGGYYPDKQMLTDENYAIDPNNHKYVLLKKDIRCFKELVSKWKEVKGRYNQTYDTVADKYKQYEKKLTSSPFWDEYLN